VALYCHVFGMRDLLYGILDCMIAFIETLCTPLGTIGNYRAIADFNILYFTVTSTSVLSLLQSPLSVS
jgi:hypothetical protein